MITDRESGWIAGFATSKVVTALLTLKEDRSRCGRFALYGRRVASDRPWDDIASGTAAVFGKVGK